MPPSFARTLLRRTLLTNAGFSAFCALLLVLEAPTFAGHLRISSAELVGLGFQLGAFAVVVGVVGMRRQLDRPWLLACVALFAVGDLAWALGSAVALARGLAWTASGVALVVATAIPVGIFGALQATATSELLRDRVLRTRESRP